jgi:hypothetical protein
MKYEDAMVLVKKQMDFATGKFPPFRSSHEGYAILKEEVDEFWHEVKANNIKLAREEVAQVAAMAIRYLMDIEEGTK